MFSVEIPIKSSQHKWQFVRFGRLGITWIITVEDYTPTRGCFSCSSVCTLKWFIVLSEKEGNENEERIIQQRLKKKKMEEIRFFFPPSITTLQYKGKSLQRDLGIVACLPLTDLVLWQQNFLVYLEGRMGSEKENIFFLYCSVANFRLI